MIHRLCRTAALCAALAVSAQQAQPRAPARFRQDDRDNDGRVTREEFSGPDALFRRLDRNADGAIVAEELRNRQGQRRTRPRFEAPAGVVLQRDVVYGTGDGRDLKLDVLLPEEPAAGHSDGSARPLVVFVHGGAFRSGDKASGLRRVLPLVRAGYVCASINYRLSGEAQWPAQIEDCKCAIRFFRAHAAAYGIDAQRIGVWGSSAGGHLVSMLGTSGGVAEFEGSGGWQPYSSRVQAVCDWFGPANFVTMATQESRMDHNGIGSPEGQLLGCVIRDNPARALHASPVTYVSADDPPFLIMHGTEDPTVPFPQSEELAAALAEAGVSVTFVPIEGAGHGGREFSSPASVERVRAFFDRHLRRETE